MEINIKWVEYSGQQMLLLVIGQQLQFLRLTHVYSSPVM
jgi:hypothetical protein